MNYQDFLASKQQYGAQSGFKPVFMSESLYDFQTYLVDWAVRLGRAAIFADCGLGKGQPMNAGVLTPTGWRRMGNLEIGDSVIASNGQSYPVTGIYPRGEQLTYTIRFSDNTSLTVDADHLWFVKSFNDKARGSPWRVIATKDLVKTPLKYGIHGQSRTWHIPLVEPVQFELIQDDFVIDPYLMGLLLGDGTISGGGIQISTPDEEIVESVQRLIPETYTIKKVKGSDYDYSITKGRGYKNELLNELRRLKLYGAHSYEKFIPRCYLFASVKDRLSILQGLMDTDGYAGESPEYSSSSLCLAQGVVFLVQSLGGTARIGVKENPTYTYKGQKLTGRTSYRVTMTLPAGIKLFRLARKANNYHAATRGLGRWIDSIDENNRQPTQCISVASPDESYVTEHFIVTHNTPMQLTWAQNIVQYTNKPVLVLAPLAVTGQTLDEATKFDIAAQRADPDSDSATAIIEITNYEKLHLFDPRRYGGIVCDESSILKNFNGKRRKEITEFMRTLPYRLLCTATAAPNDWVELGTSSEALGYLGERDMKTRFFSRKAIYARENAGRKEWNLRLWAEQGPFWQWLSTWARTARKPSDLGFDDNGFILPPIKANHIKVDAVLPTPGMLFDVPAVSFHEEREAIRRTIQERCEAAAQTVADNGATSMVWCNLNDEGDLLEKLIPGSVQVAGRHSDEKKEEAARWFVHGTDERRVLISKPSIFGFGLNFQHCQHMTYFPTWSYEKYYQASRRLWRFGQTQPVEIDLIYTDGGKRMLAGIERKEQRATEMFENLVQHMNHALHIKETYQTQKVKVPQWMKK